MAKKQTFTLSKRVHVTFPDYVYEALDRWADKQGRSTANLIAFLVETALLEAQQRGEVPSGPEDPKSDT